MNFSQKHITRLLARTLLATMAGAMVLAGLLPLSAGAVQSVPAQTAGGAAPALPATSSSTNGPMGTPVSSEITLAKSVFTLATSTPYIPTTGSFNYTVRVKPDSSATSIQLRFDVLRSNGALVYRRTRYLSDFAEANTAKTNSDDAKARKPASRVITEEFARELTGLGMEQESYKIVCQVTVGTANERVTASLSDQLVVFDETANPLPIVASLKVTSRPMRNPSGVFVLDPSVGTASSQRDAVITLSDWIISTPSAKITIAISPLMLEEWLDISDGYNIIRGDAPAAVLPAEEVCLKYGSAIERLKAAVATKRLTLCSLGYSDPNLLDMSNAGLAADIGVQYERGAKALTEILGVAPSGVTLPSWGAFASRDSTLFKQAGVTHIIVPQRAVRTKLGTAVGVIPSKTPTTKSSATAETTTSTPPYITALVAQDSLSQALASTSRNGLIAPFFSQKIANKNSLKPVVLSETLTESEAQATAVVANIIELGRQPWVTLASPTEVVVERFNKKAITVAPIRPDSMSVMPVSCWDMIAKARSASKGLVYALGATHATSSVSDNTLVAEGGPEIPVGESSIGEDICIQFATAAQEQCDATFKKVTLKMQSVTLAGSDGKIPITIMNNTGTELKANLVLQADNGIVLTDGAQKSLTLPPKETFVDPAVTLRSIVSGKMTARVVADGYVICEDTVQIHASYTDRIVLVGIVILLGAILVVVVWRKSASSRELIEP